PSGSVHGELFEVDAETRAALDRFEDHPRYFERVAIRMRDGSLAESYLPVRHDPETARIAGGSWRERDQSFAAAVRGFRATLLDAAPRLRALGEEFVNAPLGPGKWSRKQVLGHLIDSASNNHRRFVEAQRRADLDFEGYDQDAW